MVSPICTVADGAGAPQSTVSAYATATTGNTVTIALADSTGVSTWAISCIGTDETLVAATINAGITVSGVSKSATFTAPAIGTAMVFRSVVNGGMLNGVAYAPYSTTFKIAVPYTNNLVVCVPNETYEHNATFGWTGAVNAGIRGAASSIKKYTAFDANHVFAWSLGNVAGTTTAANEGSGGTADLTVTGASFGVPWTGTPSGTIAQFVSTSSNKILGTSTALTMPTSPVSMECIFEPLGSVAATQFLFEKFGVFGLSIDTLKNVVATINIGGAQATISAGIVGYTFSGRTHHVMITYDGTNSKFYVDGFLVNTVPGTGAVSVNASAFAMGFESNSANQFLQGKLGMCAVSNIARTQLYAQQVTQRMLGYATS